jgi:hypothetical protein
MPEPRPLPDLDWTAATEAVAEALCRVVDNGVLYRGAIDDYAALVVKAVWPILHDVAHAWGRDSVLDASHSHYLSTACQHEHHRLCGGAQHQRGDLTAPHCKYCPTPCACPCHDGFPVTDAARQHHPSCRRDDNHLGWCGPNE